jgi:riboflavin kinase/FMN adenylyltransferase
MQVHRSLDHLPLFTNAILTIGTFDGVHTGHQQILHQLKEEADLQQGESVIITFDPHPRKVVGRVNHPIQLLNSLSEKIELLDRQGIDHLVIVPFTREFANQPAKDYVEKFLVEKFHPHTIIIGYDHQFGHNREGNYHLLEALKDDFGFRVKEIPEHVLHNSIISSTKIRNALLAGNVAEANECLGYDYFFEGNVVEGNKLGRTIGYPTANLLISDEDKLVPGDGVYAVEVELNGLKKQGMMNIGIRPTVDGARRVKEVNIFHFDQEIYGETLRVYLKARIRSEIKFDGIDALKEQLASDKITAVQLLSIQ